MRVNVFYKALKPGIYLCCNFLKRKRVVGSKVYYSLAEFLLLISSKLCANVL